MASRTRDSIYKNEKLFLRILDERTAGLFLDADTESLRSDMRLEPKRCNTSPKPNGNNSKQQGKSYQ